MLTMKAWLEVRWRFLFLLALTVAWLAAFSVGNATSPVGAISDRPNIVVILTDDQGYADIGFNPNHSKEVSTPHMDALAGEGVFFSAAYTSGSACLECQIKSTMF